MGTANCSFLNSTPGQEELMETSGAEQADGAWPGPVAGTPPLAPGGLPGPGAEESGRSHRTEMLEAALGAEAGHSRPVKKAVLKLGSDSRQEFARKSGGGDSGQRGHVRTVMIRKVDIHGAVPWARPGPRDSSSSSSESLQPSEDLRSFHR